MSAERCELGLDANAILSALDDELESLTRGEAISHAAKCDACRSAASLRLRARSAWTASIRADDETTRAASEARLARRWPEPRVLPVRAFAFGAIAAAATITLALGAISRLGETRNARVAETTSQITPSTTSSNTPASGASSTVASVSPASPRTPSAAGHRPVATATCVDCRVIDAAGTKHEIEPGAVLAEERITVPTGSRLALGFAFDDGLVDPTSGAEVVGPATARAPDSASLVIESGRAHLRGLRGVKVVVPGATIEPIDATYGVLVRESGTRVDVTRGRVVIVTHAKQSFTVEQGSSLELDAAGAPRTTSSTTPEGALPVASQSAASKPSELAIANGTAPAPEPNLASNERALAEAQAKFRSGDTADARVKLERLSTLNDARVSRRAAFTLAEIELASGSRDKARERLIELLACPEASLAADAAMLLARSYPAPSDRAVAWSRFLATKPQSPHAERALLERADALLDARQPREAKELLDELRRSPSLTESQRRQLDRLDFKARELR